MTEAIVSVADSPSPQAPESPAITGADSESENPRLRIIEAQQNELEGLRRQLEQRETELAQARQAAERAGQESAGLRQALEAAAASVRRLLLATAPAVPEELVQGTTPEEVEQSFRQAGAMVERIKAKLEAQALRQAQGGRLPAGAPTRRPADLSALSPQEKIALALQSRPVGTSQPS